MKEKTVYIAFDGEEFEDYNECERYESKELQNKYGESLFVYNEDGKKISLDEDDRLCQDSYYITCKTKEALDYLNKIFDGYVNTIDYDGKFPASFYYDFTANRWKEIATHIKELQKEIDMLSKYIVKE